MIPPLFTDYVRQYDAFTDYSQDDLPRSLRLFNIRFRLALDIQIEFGGEVSLTKTKSVRDTYRGLIKLMEAWNAYEALFQYIRVLGRHGNFRANKSKVFSQIYLEATGSLPILKETADTLKSLYQENPRFRNDLDIYLGRFIAAGQIRKTLTKDAQTMQAFCRDQKNISGIEILSLIYAERNMYYHNGESAKMGMRYTNRKKMLALYFDCLIRHILHLIIYILKLEMEEEG